MTTILLLKISRCVAKVSYYDSGRASSEEDVEFWDAFKLLLMFFSAASATLDLTAAAAAKG